MKKLFVLTTITSSLFSMPIIIQNYTVTQIPNASASKMKDIISPTKNILSTANNIYTNELEDLNVTLKIGKYRNLKSRNHTFLINKKIQLENILVDTKSLNDSTTYLNIFNTLKD